MFAIADNPRMEEKPTANLIKHQISNFAFKTLCCNDREFTFESLGLLMEVVPWSGRNYESQEDD
jgi:hypothetical protein